ncbi:MAG TPA: hypothetical protein VGL78_04285 [Solirubrobacteraceae bacterium]|jgi:hypothetical protein
MTETLIPPPAPRADRGATGRALAVTYTARRGRRRKVVIGVDSAGEWAVYDIQAAGRVKTGKVVQALPDESDGVRQALALQADYADVQAAYQDGHREENPLPRFTRLAIGRIAEAADRAVALALTQAAAEKQTQLTDQLLALAGEPPVPNAANAA